MAQYKTIVLFSFTASDDGLKHIKQQKDILAERWDFSLCQILKNSVLLTFTAPVPEGEK